MRIESAALRTNGLAFSEFRGYEGWQPISISQNGGVFATILGNPVTIDAHEAGVPGNGKPFPDGANGEDPVEREKERDGPRVTMTLMDSKRFADSGGWGYAVFTYGTPSDTTA